MMAAHSAVRGIAAILLFGLGFSCTAGIVGALHLSDELVDAKLAELRQLGPGAAGIDVVFLGNSRVYRHVDPETFDRSMASAGHPTHSYNLGAPDMSFGELDYLVRTLQSMGLERLRWIFIDLTTSWSVDPRNLSSRRVIAWHDLRSAGIALSLRSVDAGAGSGSMTDSDGFDNAPFEHVSNFFSRLTRAGQGRDSANQLLNRAAYDPPLVGHVRGFRALRADSLRAEQRHARFLSDASGYERRVERLRQLTPVADSPGAMQEALLEQLIAEAADAGIGVVLYMPPVVSELRWMSEPGPGSPAYLYFAFNDPNRYPDFYRVSDRFDPQHLNSEAAHRFSDRLAHDFAAALDASP